MSAKIEAPGLSERHAFAGEPARLPGHGLVAFPARREGSTRVDDAVPGDARAERQLPEDLPDEPRPSGQSGLLSDLAVGGDPALRDRVDDGEDALASKLGGVAHASK